MKAIKIILIVLGSLLGLLVAAAIVVPLVVDVDKYRPQIVEAASKQINGKLELGKLSLSLWGQIRVQVQGLSLSDSAGRKVVSVNDAYFHIPFMSVLSGSPEMVFHMDRPEVLVIKNKAGKLNVMSLIKPADPAAAPPAGTTPGGAPAGGGDTSVPGIAANARLGVELRNALLTYKDELTGLTTALKDLNLVARNLSLTRTSDIEFWADLDTQMGKTLAVKGPARMTAKATPTLVNNAFDKLSLQAKVDLDGLDISAGGAFHKAKGMAANADLVMTASQKEAQIERFVLNFFNVEVKASGTVSNLGAQPATPGAVPPSPIVNLTIASNEIDFKPWNQLIPMLSAYELGGKAKLDAKANGSADKLAYQGKLAVVGLTAKAGDLKAQPRFDALVEVVPDQVKNLELTMKAPGNDLKLSGRVVSFTQPQVNLELTSTGLDLDQLIKWPPPPAAPAKGEAAPAAGGGGTGGAQTAAASSDTDALLEPLRSNPTAAKSAAVMNFNLKSIKAKEMVMTDMVGKLYFKDLTAGLDGFATKMFGGTIKANFAANLKPKTPTYTFSSVVDKMDLYKAVEANVAMFKNTVVGLAHFEINGAGSSFNTEPAKGNLKAKGSFKIDNAKFGTIDVGRMAAEAVNKGLERVAEKVPQVKGKTVGSPGGRETKYEFISADFTIEGGKFVMPNFMTKAAPNQGIDLKGNTQVGLKDYALATQWEVIDTFDMLGARKISVEQQGVKVDHLLAEGDGPVKFVVTAGCTCMAPCYSYTQVPEYLAKVALSNVASAVGAKAKAEVAKKIEQVVPKAAPPAVQNAVKDLGKKVFH